MPETRTLDPTVLTGRRSALFGLLLVSTLASPSTAFATPQIGAHDVQTLFFVSKSDDRNRVDYGIHLDEACLPVGRAPVFAYWRRFEPGDEPLGSLNTLDEQIYGIRHQAVRTTAPNGSWVEMRINGLPDERILVLIQRMPDGCRARAHTTLSGRPVYLRRVHAELATLVGIDHLLLHGVDRRTGAAVRERRDP
ncbi:MAG: DUF4833 domain-containing protein [Sandaracinaceae bacterium]